MRDQSTKHVNAIIEVIKAAKSMVVTGNDLYSKGMRQTYLKANSVDLEYKRYTHKFATGVARDVLGIAEIQARLQTLVIRAGRRAEAENLRCAKEQLVEANEVATTANNLLTENESAERELYP